MDYVGLLIGAGIAIVCVAMGFVMGVLAASVKNPELTKK